jgi:hypothetical protein
MPRHDALNSPSTSPAARWGVVVLFAIGMAWVEAAAVLYLRTLVGRLDPYQATPLPMSTGLGTAELVREAATLIMLATVGWLAGHHWRERLAFFLIAFGVWDIFYYVFLRPLTGWPNSLLDWDVLFLLPLPWWGPVWAPVSIAVLMIAWGTLMTLGTPRDGVWRFDWRCYAANAAGIVLALYVFMADAIRVAPQGGTALRALLPTDFNGLLFGCAWLLMAVPVFHLMRQLSRNDPRIPGEEQAA